MAFSLWRHSAQLLLLPHLKKPGGRGALSPPLLKIFGTWALKIRSLMFFVLVYVTRGGSGKYMLIFRCSLPTAMSISRSEILRRKSGYRK